MTVVSNASPIINLDAVGHLDLLQELYDEVLIPPAVYEEVTAAPEKPGARAVQGEDWITHRSLKRPRLASALLDELDPGEAQAIALAVETDVELLLLDEQAGRHAACRLEVDHVGTSVCSWRQSTRITFLRFVPCWMRSVLRPAFGSATHSMRKCWT